MPDPPPSASSRRSATREPAGSVSGCSGFPAWVLLDKTAQIGYCNNETTAQGTTRKGSPIEASFHVVDPPALSLCVVHYPDLEEDKSVSPVRVLGGDGAFLVIRVFFPPRDGKRHFSDVFVYRAGSPSLVRIPEPYPVGFISRYAGVLSCGDSSEHCLVVHPEEQIEADGRMRYDLHVFSTKTRSWSTRVAQVAFDLVMHYGEFEASRVFSVGGISLAWVDLRYGILLCEELDKDPEMRLIELPALMPTNAVDYRVRSNGGVPPLDPIRDVTCRNGWFWFVELESLESVDSSTSLPGWRAIITKMKIGSLDWELCRTVSLPSYVKEHKLTLNEVSFPILDRYNDDVVYLISKRKANDPNGWMLAVNTKSKKLEKVVRFYAGKLYFHCFYLQCGFSKHLTKAPGTCTSNELKGTISREDQLPLLLCVFSILVVKQKFRQFEKNLIHQRSCYNGVCSPYHPGLASTLDLHIQQLSQYAISNGLGKAAYDAVTLFHRASEEIDNHCKDPSACVEALRFKIDVAVGALDNLLQIVPSDVLDTGRSALSACTDKKSVDGVSIVDQFASQSLSFVL